MPAMHMASVTHARSFHSCASPQGSYATLDGLKRPIPRADFTGADLYEAQMSGVDAVAADFEEALMKGTEIVNSNMCGANFAFAYLRKAKIGELCPT